MEPFSVFVIEDNSITILTTDDESKWDASTEVVHWIVDEWREDEHVVFGIGRAIVLALTDPEELLRRLGKEIHYVGEDGVRHVRLIPSRSWAWRGDEE